MLGNYGDQPSALALYAVFNIVASLALLRLLGHIRANQLGQEAEARRERTRLLADVVVLVICIPGAYLLRDNGPWLLLLLAVSGRISSEPGKRSA